MRVPLATLLLVGALACGGASPVDPVVEQSLSGVVTSNGVKLTNATDHKIYYAAFEKRWATDGLFLWGPCVEPASCPSIAARNSVVIPFSKITGYNSTATQVLVHHYELSPAAGGTYELKNLRSMVVDF